MGFVGFLEPLLLGAVKFDFSIILKVLSARTDVQNLPPQCPHSVPFLCLYFGNTLGKGIQIICFYSKIELDGIKQYQ